MEKIAKILEKAIITEVKKVINKPNCEKDLWQLWDDFWEDLKKIKGQSKNLTGVSEMIFQEALKIMLCKKGISEFKPFRYTNDTKYFKSGEIIMTWDLKISTHSPYLKLDELSEKYEKKDDNGKSLEITPDIAVFKKNGESYQPIAVFEIKTYPASLEILENDLMKMKDFDAAPLKFSILKSPPKTKPYWIGKYPNVKSIVGEKTDAIPSKNLISFEKAVDLIYDDIKKK